MKQDEFVVTITIDIIDGQREALLKALGQLFSKARKVDGCIVIRVHEDIANPNKLLVYEIWESETLWKKYLTLPYLVQFSEDTRLYAHEWKLGKFKKISI